MKIGILCLALLGVPLIIGLWETIPGWKPYQLISFLIAGILYNMAYWKLSSQNTKIKKEVKNENSHKRTTNKSRV